MRRLVRPCPERQQERQREGGGQQAHHAPGRGLHGRPEPPLVREQVEEQGAERGRAERARFQYGLDLLIAGLADRMR